MVMPSGSSNSTPIFLIDDTDKYLNCNFIKIKIIKKRIHKKGLRISKKSIKFLKIFFNKQIEGYLDKLQRILNKNNRVTIKPTHFRQLFREENVRIRILEKGQKKLDSFV